MLRQRRLSRVALLVLLVFVTICCLLPATPFLFDALFPIWARLTAPNPSRLATLSSRLLAGNLSDRVYHFEWMPDGNSLTLFRNNSTAQKDDTGHFVQTVDLQTGRMSDEVYVPDVPDQDAVFARCPAQNVWVAVEQRAEEQLMLVLRRSEQVIAAFPFTSTQKTSNSYAPAPEYASFSPDCRYVAITLAGWLYYEQDAREELWLLDIPTQSLRPVLLGRWPAFRLWDYPVQSVRASWAANSTELVFGDGRFGLEILDVVADKRRWLASPEQAGYGALWSPTGNWIAATRFGEPGQPHNVVIISADGQQIAVSPPCALIFPIQWAASNDRLAYLCSQSSPNNKSTSVWVWELP